ncbi:hypothetical protein L227DRAFT_609439 [Lentinus tigrinus ALCF2SS1-6]|uniref:Uncharacterized protein n=1 Tax=Lentinus tigrinus ALCF2SS1-6 TaxID=1328759 RepID=A0A5C2SEL9_9APHY|nr:hypothetical protein L227DRAFT_609439 [Lentinus tigrinus ALCF2SS1-6]
MFWGNYVAMIGGASIFTPLRLVILGYKFDGLLGRSDLRACLFPRTPRDSLTSSDVKHTLSTPAMHYLLREYGYKETKVFIPKAERMEECMADAG